MADLFGSDVGEKIPAPGASLTIFRSVVLPTASSTLLAKLIGETPWRQETITVWGKQHLQPRLVAWYGDPDKAYSYSGVRLKPLPWTDLIMSLRETVERLSSQSFNSVLLNYYRDGNDSMGFHSDDEPELGERPVIASLSVGANRTLVFKSKGPEKTNDIRVQLHDSSLLIMSGDTQKNWKHGIGKVASALGPRVNLTFRTIH